LFPNLKKSLTGQKFESSEVVIAAMEAYFADLKKTYFSGGLKKLEHRWVKCIELKGDYVEKKLATFPKFSFFFCRLSTYRTTLVYSLLFLLNMTIFSLTWSIYYYRFLNLSIYLK
jgi:hypothetical protein